MRDIHRILGMVLLCLTAQSARASQEHFTVWNNAKIVCDACEETGVVTIEAAVRDGAYKALKISAFGKEHELGGEDLLKLRGFPLSSVLVTAEPGYPNLGGYSVHLRLKRISYEGNKAVLEEDVIITVCKEKPKEVTVSKSQKKMN